MRRLDGDLASDGLSDPAGAAIDLDGRGSTPGPASPPPATTAAPTRPRLMIATLACAPAGTLAAHGHLTRRTLWLHDHDSSILGIYRVGEILNVVICHVQCSENRLVALEHTHRRAAPVFFANLTAVINACRLRNVWQLP